MLVKNTRKEPQTSAKMFQKMGEQFKKPQFKVVIDSINVDQEMRAKFLSTVNVNNTYVVCVCMNYPKEFTIHINRLR